MAARFIEFEGKSYVFGLAWRTLDGEESESSEIRKLAGDTGVEARHYVKLAKKDISCGFLPRAEVGKHKVSGLYSAAALLALTADLPPSFLFIKDLDDGKSVMVGVLNGTPVPGYDLCASHIEIRRAAEDFITTAGDGVTIYGETTLFEDAHPLGLGSFLEPRKEALLQPLPSGGGRIVIIIASIVVLAAAGGWYAWDQHRQEEIRKAKEKQQMDPNKVYQDALPGMMKKAGIPARTGLPSMLASINPMHTAVAGWNLDQVACTPQECRVTLVQDVGTFASFRKAMPDAKSVVFGLDGKKIEYVLSAESPPAATGVGMGDLSPFTDFLVTSGSQFQEFRRIGTSYSLTAATIYGAPAGIDPNAVKNPVKAGNWTVGGRWWMHGVLNYLPPNVTLDSFTVKMRGGDPVFEAKGKYYVKD